ncbi:MAG: TolB family protein, partial [Woeseiaceae bacterium]
MKRSFFAIVLLVLSSLATAQETVTKGDDLSVDVALDGRLAIDLLDSIWILPAGGGAAEKIPEIQPPASRPRWSPLDDSIVYQTTINGLDQIQLYRFASGLITNVSDSNYLNQQPSWHPLGERILFSSDRHESGFDLWEYDIDTGLSWRISHLDGDELDPAWSSDGRDLIYVHQQDGFWRLMLRRFGQPERVLVNSNTKISAPQWRPDGSLITYLQTYLSRSAIEMAILSKPLLVRPLIEGEDFGSAPVSWIDRQQLLYTAGGSIRRRDFNAWSSVNVPFRATLLPPEEDVVAQPVRELSLDDMPDGNVVIRTA